MPWEGLCFSCHLCRKWGSLQPQQSWAWDVGDPGLMPPSWLFVPVDHSAWECVSLQMAREDPEERL